MNPWPRYTQRWVSLQVRVRAASAQDDDRFMIDDLRAMLPDMQYVYEPAMMFADGDDIGIVRGLGFRVHREIHCFTQSGRDCQRSAAIRSTRSP